MDYEVNLIVKNQPFAGPPRRSEDQSMADTASASALAAFPIYDGVVKCCARCVWRAANSPRVTIMAVSEDKMIRRRHRCAQ